MLSIVSGESPREGMAGCPFSGRDDESTSHARHRAVWHRDPVSMFFAVGAMLIFVGWWGLRSSSAFESQWPQHTPDKGEAIRQRLGVSPTRYYQQLIRAASSLDGIAAYPITARHVRERAEAAAARRGRRAA